MLECIYQQMGQTQPVIRGQPVEVEEYLYPVESVHVSIVFCEGT